MSSSDPSNPSAALIPQNHHHHHHQAPTPSTTAVSREYRKGNWTPHETLVLITAKRLDDERRRSRLASGGGAAPRAAELRWKWVENYCWKNDCLRSQNQCNDKWDNLLRDYKKVRDFEAQQQQQVGPAAADRRSYWAMEKPERKERNLPSNLSAEVFEALSAVVGRRNAHRSAAAASAAPVSSLPPPPLALPQATAAQAEDQPPPEMAPAPSMPQPPLQPSVSTDHPSATSGSDINGPSESESKRRRARSGVVRGASMLARTLLACEDRRDKRHRDMVELEERRLRMEEDRTEMSRQGIAGLISAVNGLSGAIHALVRSPSDKRD